MKPIFVMPLIMFCMLVSPPSFATDQVELMQLKHIVAEEIIPIIKPLLESDTVITGKGYQLIVRGTPSSLDTIRSMIQRIDVPQRILKIALRHVEHSKVYGRSISATGSIVLDKDAKVTLGGDMDPLSDEITLRAKRHSTQGRGDTLYEVRAVEGHPTFLRLGKSVPYELQRYITTGRHIGYGHRIGHKELSSGFFVIPRIKGEFVSLVISSQQQRLSGNNTGAIESRHLSTSVRGRIGDWITLGTVQVGMDVRDKKINSRSMDTNNDGYSVQIKVELVR